MALCPEAFTYCTNIRTFFKFNFQIFIKVAISDKIVMIVKNVYITTKDNILLIYVCTCFSFSLL